jgi:hypothetical protein
MFGNHGSNSAAPQKRWRVAPKVATSERVTNMSPNREDETSVDLANVKRLVDALERDLAKVQDGSGDLDTLRAEVEQLGAALREPEVDDDVHLKLHGIRALLRKIENELIDDALKAGDYITRIGRMLGM